MYSYIDNEASQLYSCEASLLYKKPQHLNPTCRHSVTLSSMSSRDESSSATEYLEHLRKLLKLEEQEERMQYELFLKDTTFEQRRFAGVAWFPLRIKETGIGLGGYPYVVVERTTHLSYEHKLAGGRPAELFSAGAEGGVASGTIHYLRENELKIILASNKQPEWLHAGKLGIQLGFDTHSYQVMDGALNTAINAKSNRLQELREVLHGSARARFTKEEIQELPNYLNQSQRAAVAHVVRAQDVALVHGPPGTGKTTTLVAAIGQLIKEGKVLVCAPSNSAADLLTERLAGAGIRVVRMGNLARIDDEILSHTLEHQVERHQDAGLVKKLRKEAAEYKRQASAYKRNFGREERQQRIALKKEAKDIDRHADSVESYLIDNVLEGAQAVVTTLVGSNNKYLEGQQYSALVVDEAAQALEPATWIPVAKANKVVLAGDPYQLPPTIRSLPAAKAGLAVTLLERALPHLKEGVLLQTQYRMNKEIMSWSNTYFYNGRLQAHDTVEDRHFEGDEAPIVFIDTAGAGYLEVLNQESRSYYNPPEAEVLAHHLKGLISKGNKAEPLSIGVIAPYRQQIRYLEEALPTLVELPEAWSLTINTIDSFQGQERDVMYISFTRSNHQGEIGFLSDYRRTNVAMTRARLKLIMIGDSATLASDAFYAGMIAHVEAEGSFVSVWELEDFTVNSMLE